MDYQKQSNGNASWDVLYTAFIGFVRLCRSLSSMVKNAVNLLKSPLSEYNEVLSDYRRQANSMKMGSYVNKGVTLTCVVIAGLCVVLSCGLGYWCSQLKQERDMYKAGYEKLYMERTEKKK